MSVILDDTMMDQLADGARIVVSQTVAAYINQLEGSGIDVRQLLWMTAAGVVTAAADLTSKVNQFTPHLQEKLAETMIEQFRESFAVANASRAGSVQ